MRRSKQVSGQLSASKTVKHKYLPKAKPSIDTALYNALTRQEQRQVDRVLVKVPAQVLEQGEFAQAKQSIEFHELTERGVQLAFSVYGHDYVIEAN